MEPEKRLQALIDLLDTKQNADEIIQAFGLVVDIAQAVKEGNEEERSAIRDFLTNATSQIQAKLSAVRDGKDGWDGYTPRKGLDYFDGNDGYTPQKGVDYIDGENGKDGSPDTPEQIADKLNTLEDIIDPKVIKGLTEEIKKHAPQHTGTNFVVARGGVKYYDISGSLDGSTKTFTLPAFWRVILVVSSSAPGVLRPTTDYTVDVPNSQITFTAAIDAPTTLAAGQTIQIIYAENN